MSKSNDEIIFGKFFYPKSSMSKKWAKTISQRGKIKAEVQRLEWHKTEDGLKGPMSQTLALQAITDDIGGYAMVPPHLGRTNGFGQARQLDRHITGGSPEHPAVVEQGLTSQAVPSDGLHSRMVR